MSDNDFPAAPGEQPPAPPAAYPYAQQPHAPAQPQAQMAAYPPPPPPQAQSPYPQAQHPYPQPYPQGQMHGYAATAPAQPTQPYPGAYPQFAAPLYPAPRPASGAAITSLICGIAGALLFWLLVPILASIVAIITGHMALRQTRSDPNIGGRGMAFAGLIMGYIVVGLSVISIALSVIGFIFLGAFTLPFLNSY